MQLSYMGISKEGGDTTGGYLPGKTENRNSPLLSSPPGSCDPTPAPVRKRGDFTGFAGLTFAGPLKGGRKDIQERPCWF